MRAFFAIVCVVLLVGCSSYGRCVRGKEKEGLSAQEAQEVCSFEAGHGRAGGGDEPYFGSCEETGNAGPGCESPD